QATQQVVVLDRQGDALADVLAEPRVDRAGVAAAHHQIHATTGEVLEEGVILGDLHRVVGGDQGGGGGEQQVLGLRCDIGEVGGGGGWDEGWVVVLAGGEDIEADLLGLERDLGHRVDALALGRGGAVGGVGGYVTDGEEAELHGGS